MDISVLRCYGYIRYIEDISTDILIQNIDDIKINKILKIFKKILKNYIKSKNRYFKIISFKILNIYIYIICHIW